MQTSVDSQSPASPSRSRSRLVRWLAVAVVVVAAGVAVLVRMLTGGPDEPVTLEDHLAARVVAVLEEATADEHAAHGHYLEDGSGGYVCVARTIGFEPPDATEVAQVQTVYADHACAELGTVFQWPEVVRSTGPLAMTLTTDPATVALPSQVLLDESSALHVDRVREVIPAAYHDLALAHQDTAFTDPDLFDELQGRYRSAR